ncbi:MAG: hypothetical protein ACRES8_01845 [Nevskiaceae bacterium]
MRRAALVLAGFCFVNAAPARAALTLSAGWQQDHEPETGLLSSGFGGGLGVDLGNYFFLSFGGSSMRTESFEDAVDGVEGRLEHRSGSAELGAVWPWTARLGVTATGGYAVAETRGLDGFGDDRAARFDGPTGSLTLWWQPSSILAFNVGRSYSYMAATPGWDTSAGAGLRLWGQTWLDAGYWRGDGVEGWTAGLRWTFAGD